MIASSSSVNAMASNPSAHCASAGRVTARLLLSFLVFSQSAAAVGAAKAAPPHHPHGPILEPIPVPPPGAPSPGGETRELDFRLAHVFHHGTYEYPELHRRLDVATEAPLWVMNEETLIKEPASPVYKARSSPMKIQRLRDRSKSTIDSMLEVGRMTGKAVDVPLSAWTVDDVPGPDITHKESVLSMARMAANAYVLVPSTGEWQDVGSGFNYTEDFGWESDGLRGHIFADTKNETVIIGLKGTSPAVFDGSETTTNDKLNDNLFFSCCCGQGGQYLWRQVCNCQTSTYQCNSTCLVSALKDRNRYYFAAQDLYHNVTALYPDAEVWVTGHSLGGSVSSLLGLTFGLPVVSFEAVPEAMPASRLGLPVPPGHQVGTMQARPNTGGYHFGHTADPVFMGTCNGASSSCTFAGYAMQSVCHTGSKCVYDTVGDLGWRVGIGTHKIVAVIRDVLEKYDDPAICQQYTNCTDCYAWEFYESNGTDSTTTVPTSTSTWTRTRTSTCKTPGWWGCLDESTSETTTTTTTTTVTTTTCKTPGWFGCKDPKTTTTGTTTSVSTPAMPAPTITTPSSFPTATSTSCSHKGWFGGCHDHTATWTTSSSYKIPTPTHTHTHTHTSCTSHKWFGLICADPKTPCTTTSSIPNPPSDPWQEKEEMR